MNVYALINSMSGILLTADPSKNLFSADWTEGNLYGISGLVEKLGGFACTVISIVGFGIVIFSILKNAMSGLYVVNPNFWDRVDEIKTQAVSDASDLVNNATGGSSNVAVQKLGSFMSFLLGYIPNIKALTDFDEGDVPDKKQYFMKAIPLLVAQIFIGMLIFFGYPAKIANWIGTGATAALSAVLNNYDPVSIVTGLSDSFVTYHLSTDGSTDPWEQNVNKMASEMTTIMHTRYGDMQNDVVQQYAYAIEQNLLSAMDEAEIRNVIGAKEGYSYSINATISNSNPGVSSAYSTVGGNSQVYRAMATNGTYSFKYILPVPTIITDSSATTKAFSSDFFIWTINATPVAVSSVSTSQFIALGGVSELTTGLISNSSAGTATMSITGAKWGKTAGTGYISGSLGKACVVNFCDSSGVSVFSTSATVQTQAINPVDGNDLQLVFSYNDVAKISGLANVDHIDVNLTGGWTTTARNSDNIETSLSVTTLRIVKGALTAPKFYNTAWVNSATTTENFVAIDSVLTSSGPSGAASE